MIRYATTLKVALAWLAGIEGLSADVVGEQLPDVAQDGSLSWAETGFITVTAAGGASNIYVPTISPVVMLQCFAVQADGIGPAWNLARDLAEAVRAGCFNADGIGYELELPYSDQNARVLSAYFVSEPRPSYGDHGDYAVITVDLRLHWVAKTS